MSSFYTLIRENPTRVFDPIIDQVITGLVRKVGLNKFLGDSNINVEHNRSSNSKFNNPDGTNRWSTDWRLDVKVETHLNPSSDQWIQANMPYNMPSQGMSSYWRKNYRQVFVDPEINFSCQEITLPCTMDFEFEFTCPDYEAALHLMGWIFNRTHEGSINEEHDLVYTYPLDGEILAALWHVYSRRSQWQKQNPTANHLFDYINHVTQSRWSFETRRPDMQDDTTNTQFANEWQAALKRVQLGCIGQLTCEQGAPEKNNDGESSNVFTVKFNYRILFGRPHMLEFTMPVVIEQSPLPPIFFHDEPKSANLELSGAYQDLAYQPAALWNAGAPYIKERLTRYPRYDDWALPYRTQLSDNKYLPFICGVMTLDVVGEPVSLSVKDFPDIEIHPLALEIMQMHGKEDILSYEGLFNITVFSNNIRLDPAFISWDPTTLTITFTADRPTHVYRIVVSETTVLDRIDRKWAEVVATYRWFFPMTIIENLNYLIKTGAMTIGTGNELTTLISGLRSNGMLWPVVDDMVAQGAVSNLAQYTQTNGQFASYICNHPFQFPDPSLYNKPTGTLFDLFASVCVARGLFTQSLIPRLQVDTIGVNPYQVTDGGLLYGFNSPLRVCTDRLRTIGGGGDHRRSDSASDKWGLRAVCGKPS